MLENGADFLLGIIIAVKLARPQILDAPAQSGEGGVEDPDSGTIRRRAQVHASLNFGRA